MTCDDFERLCQERLDAHALIAFDDDPAWKAHLISCATCRATVHRYHTLQLAIAAWAAPIEAPAGFAEKVLAEHHSRPILKPIWSRPPIRWAAAATFLLATLIGLRLSRRDDVPRPAPVAAAEPRPLGIALAEATSATLALAKATSEPAARVGRDVLGSADWSASATAAALWPTVPVAPGPGVLQEVGQRVGSGVRPLTGSARSAFGFLLAPVSGEAPPPSPVEHGKKVS